VKLLLRDQKQMLELVLHHASFFGRKQQDHTSRSICRGRSVGSHLLHNHGEDTDKPLLNRSMTTLVISETALRHSKSDCRLQNLHIEGSYAKHYIGVQLGPHPTMTPGPLLSCVVLVWIRKVLALRHVACSNLFTSSIRLRTRVRPACIHDTAWPANSVLRLIRIRQN
jgi:hypothetical protein